MSRIAVMGQTARGLAAAAIAHAAAQFPFIEPTTINTDRLAARDAALAVAIHRTVLQRWLTLEYLLDLHLHKPLASMQPEMAGVLLSGAAQLVFFERLPAHAVVDESVKLAHEMVRPQAAGMVNAVLRRVSESVVDTSRDPWIPAVDALPVDTGQVRLRHSLPPLSSLPDYLAVATSHPRALVESWLAQFGEALTVVLTAHGVATPPVVVVLEPDFDFTAAQELVIPHVMAGFGVWTGTARELSTFVKSHPCRRVQDSASTQAVASTAAIKSRLILDLCAGRGTKTRQLAVLHPSSRVLATDIDPSRFQTLREAASNQPNVAVVQSSSIESETRRAGGADLVLLDVPCSNTAVLARRPEARYRYSPESLASLRRTQRRILEQSRSMLRAGAHVLYSTCSLDRGENQDQAQWFCDRFGATMVSESLTLPSGRGPSYQDGSYYALLRMP
ncbi:MAG: hypothetical protein IT444_03555 [Phycisphaeraceae bacterium]|nr:hypothetical protein [Phycisphaeraceae bacterium]